MLKVRIKMIDGTQYIVETEMDETAFDDKVLYSAPTEFIKTPEGIRLQFAKMISHQPLGETHG